MKMKKLVAVAMMVFLLIGVVGCGSEEVAETADSEETQIYTIGICQLVRHDALDEATKGFRDVLTEKLGDQAVFNEQNASGDPAVCSTIANQFVAENVDLILANGTPALQACSNATATIPIIGTSITDFGTALSIEMGSEDATGINVTGTNDLAPIDQQAEQIVELFPDVETVGILYCSAEANSKFQADVMRECLDALGVESTDYTFTDSNDVQAVTTAAVANCDLIWIPTDNTAASNGSIIDNIAIAAEVPIIAGEEGICRNTNSVATLSIDFYAIGCRAGEMAYDILVNGADPATMNIESPAEVTPLYIPEMAEMYGVTIPEGYEVLDAEE